MNICLSSQNLSLRSDRLRARLRSAMCCFVSLLGLATSAAAAPPQVLEAYVNAPVPEVWRLLTTSEGYVLGGASQAAVELKLGGEIRTGAADAMIEEILSYEPEHMLSTRIKRLPTALGVAAPPAGWSVIYLTPLGETMTQIKRLDFLPANTTADSASDAVQQFLLTQNRTLFQRLERHYAPKCKLCLKEEAAAETSK